MDGIREVLPQQQFPLTGEQNSPKANEWGVVCSLSQLPPEARVSGYYHVFNVFDEWHSEQLATGLMYIPACEYGFAWVPDGAPGIYKRVDSPKGTISYSRPCLVPKVVHYGVRKEITKADLVAESGLAVVADLLGVPQSHPMIGIPNGLGGKSKSQDLTEWGCFLARGEVPTPSELASAQKSLIGKLRQVRTAGDAIFRKGPMHMDDISEQHRKADAYLVQHGLASPAEWNKEIVASIPCPGCGEPVNSGIAFHGGKLGCGAIINEDLYKKIKWADNSTGSKARK